MVVAKNNSYYHHEFVNMARQTITISALALLVKQLLIYHRYQ
jgi:hypothetical protein